MIYPVTVRVEPALVNRNRLTVGVRLLLAIPHLILVGGVGIGFALKSGRGDSISAGGETGILGVAAYLLAIVSWILIVIGRNHPQGIREFTRFYMRWRVRALAYLMLLEDEYPPFGDGLYPAGVELRAPQGPRDRVSVAFRLILAIPHLIAVWALGIAWAITSLIAWFAILLTGRYPRDLYQFGVGVLRWSTRVEAYLLLLYDEYPPFSLS